MNTFKRLALVVTLVVAMGAGFGCAKKQTGADVAPATTADDNGAANAAIERAAQAITDGIVYFDFDKSDIKAESRDMLRQKAELMKAYPSIRVRIEGNCDARGTQEYNLALGERRARAAYEYLVMLGVNPDQMEMISFGKERPAVEGTGPAVSRNGAWRSLVAHLVWDQGVAGSNPVAPTRITQKDSSTAGVLFFCPSFSPSPLSASFRASLQAPFPAASYPCGPIAIPRTAAHASASLPSPARHLTPLIETIIVSPRCASYALGNDT